MSKKQTNKIQPTKYNAPKEPLKIDFGCGQNCTVVPLEDGSGVCTKNKILHEWEFKGLDAKCKTCGATAKKFTGVDFVKCAGVDVVHNLTQFPYPFKDESVDEIVANHFVEHLTGEDFMSFMDECWRILKPEGVMQLVHPYCFSARAFQDPTHKTFIPAERYLYFDKNWRKANKLDHYPIKSDYEYQVFVSYHTEKGENWMLKSDDNRNFSMAHMVNVVADLIVKLKKR